MKTALLLLMATFLAGCAMVFETSSGYKVIGWPGTTKRLSLQCSGSSTWGWSGHGKLIKETK